MARRIPGIFVPCDVNLASDVAIMRAGAMPELLYRRGLEHAKKTDRDGLIYEVELGDFSRGITTPAKHAATLVKVGLWIKEGDAWRIKGWSKWNASADEREDAKRLKRLGALKTNHNLGRHDGAPETECPTCQASLQRTL